MADAPTTVNLLGTNEALLGRNTSGIVQDVNNYISEWVVTSLNGSYEMDDTRKNGLTPSYYSMAVTPTDSDPIVLDLENQSVLSTQAYACNLAFSANIRSTKAVTVTCGISQQTETPGNVTITADHQQLVRTYPDYVALVNTDNIPGAWTAFRSNYYPIIPNGSALNTSDYSMRVKVTVTGHEGATFYLTTCALIDDTAFFKNAWVQTGQSYIPTFYWDIDAKEVNPTYPFYKLLDIMTTRSNAALGRYKRWFDFELTELRARDTGEEFWTSSTLTDPAYHEEEVRPWLAQFIGASIRSNVWATGNNTNAAGNAATGAFESWLADETAYIKWQFTNGYYGLHAGTRDAVLESVRQVLTGTKAVSINPGSSANSGTAQAGSGTTITLAAGASATDDIYNAYTITITGGTGIGEVQTITDYNGTTKVATVASWGTNPDSTSTYTVTSHWHILLQTIISETPDATTAGDISAPVLDAVELARPMGYYYTHAVVAALYLTLNNMGIGRLDQYALSP